MSKWIGVTILAAAVGVMTLGCSQQSGTAVVIEDKTYTVTPASVKVKAGILTGEVIELGQSVRRFGLAEFQEVFLAELLPLRRARVEPAAELRGRRQIAQPGVNPRAFLGHTARPKAINKDADTVARRWLVGGALEGDGHRSGIVALRKKLSAVSFQLESDEIICLSTRSS